MPGSQRAPSLRPLPDSQSPASGPSPTPSPRPQAPPRLPVPGLRPSPPPPALLLPLAALNQLLAAGAISFQLPSNARKCLREEIHKDRLVTDSSGHILYSKEEATKGKFAFTTDDYDMFEICFESRLPPDRQGGEAEAT
ncbi:transmembrane emp24 domain-containing protein 10-like [Heptranchias perlo]|uniref:transmembrane emp24 domain-containing protein 10-like n=1 Tax=Heptranchias perlo TaxID=212740 RepID=UPI00355AA2F2